MIFMSDRAWSGVLSGFSVPSNVRTKFIAERTRPTSPRGLAPGHGPQERARRWSRRGGGVRVEVVVEVRHLVGTVLVERDSTAVRVELVGVGRQGCAGRVGGRDAVEREASHDDQARDVVVGVTAVGSRAVLRGAEPVTAVPGPQGRGRDAEPARDGGDGEAGVRGHARSGSLGVGGGPDGGHGSILPTGHRSRHLVQVTVLHPSLQTCAVFVHHTRKRAIASTSRQPGSGRPIAMDRFGRLHPALAGPEPP